MASGFGLKGGVGKCYPFFADYKHCVQSIEDDSRIICLPFKVDYLECLSHRMEYQRVKEINTQYKKNLEAAKAKAAPDPHSH